MKIVKNTDKIIKSDKPQISDKQAEEAIRTILEWIGENPKREGLIETPRRVIKAFKEYFRGYTQDPSSELKKTFGDVEGYDDMVFQKIFLYQVIVSITWPQLFVLLMLHTYQKNGSLD